MKESIYLVLLPLGCSTVCRGRLVAGLNLLDCSGFEELASLLVQKFDLTEQKFECSGIISGGGGR